MHIKHIKHTIINRIQYRVNIQVNSVSKYKSRYYKAQYHNNILFHATVYVDDDDDDAGLSSVDGTNFKVRGTCQAQALEIFCCSLHFFGFTRRIVVLVSAFLMVSTVWSLCFLFHSRCSRAQSFVKMGGTFPREL